MLIRSFKHRQRASPPWVGFEGIYRPVVFFVKRDVLQGASCTSAAVCVCVCVVNLPSVLASLPAQKHQAE